jgi:hypothetical protein
VQSQATIWKASISNFHISLIFFGGVFSSRN